MTTTRQWIEIPGGTGSDRTTNALYVRGELIVPATFFNPAQFEGSGAEGSPVSASPLLSTVTTLVARGDDVFGPGIDGDLDFDGAAPVLGMAPVGGVYTLTQPLLARNLTVAAGAEIETSGWPVFVRGVLTGGGKIHRNGNSANGANGGAAKAAGYLPGGGAGANAGVNVAGTAATASTTGASFYDATAAAGGAAGPGGSGTGGNGTNGGTCHGAGGGGGGTGNGGGAGGAISKAGNQYDWKAPDRILKGRVVGEGLFGNCTGGGSGGSAGQDGVNGQGGGGGGAAGWVVVTAAISQAPLVRIEAKGGAGGDGVQGSGGGGGGGAGGVVICCIGGGTMPVFDVSGGTGGAGRNLVTAVNRTGGNGGAGGAGQLIAWMLTG